jgi:hypothetical protein
MKKLHEVATDHVVVEGGPTEITCESCTMANNRINTLPPSTNTCRPQEPFLEYGIDWIHFPCKCTHGHTGATLWGDRASTGQHFFAAKSKTSSPSTIAHIITRTKVKPDIIFGDNDFVKGAFKKLADQALIATKSSPSNTHELN